MASCDTRFANILTIGGEGNHLALIAVRTRIAGDDKLRFARQLDHEGFCLEAEFSLILAFGAAPRPNPARLWRIDIGQPKFYTVNSATISIRPID